MTARHLGAAKTTTTSPNVPEVPGRSVRSRQPAAGAARSFSSKVHSDSSLATAAARDDDTIGHSQPVGSDVGRTAATSAAETDGGPAGTSSVESAITRTALKWRHLRSLTADKHIQDLTGCDRDRGSCRSALGTGMT